MISDMELCYNSGKISGMSYLGAYRKFEEYDRLINSTLQMQSCNPMICGLRSSSPYWMHIIFDLYLLVRCDAVFFQPDWIHSRGARIEYRVAKLLGKKLFFHHV